MTTKTNKPIRRRKVSTGAENRDVDYGVLKSMIRDEVNLQVKRKMIEVIKPLYQVLMTDPRYDLKTFSLPQWAQDLLDQSVGGSEDPDIININDEDFWR